MRSGLTLLTCVPLTAARNCYTTKVAVGQHVIPTAPLLI